MFDMNRHAQSADSPVAACAGPCAGADHNAALSAMIIMPRIRTVNDREEVAVCGTSRSLSRDIRTGSPAEGEVQPRYRKSVASGAEGRGRSGRDDWIRMTGPVSAPQELVTDRLALRRWTSDDIETVLGGRRALDWADDFPAEGDRVVAGLLRQLDPVAVKGHRLVVERGSGMIVGSIGWFWPPKDGALEVGYGIVPSRRGRGCAPEAVRALVEFAFTTTEVETVFANVEPSNPASVRVVEKAGFGHRITLPEENLVRLSVRRAEIAAATG